MGKEIEHLVKASRKAQREEDVKRAIEWLNGFLEYIGYDDFDIGVDDTKELINDLKKYIIKDNHKPFFQ